MSGEMTQFRRRQARLIALKFGFMRPSLFCAIVLALAGCSSPPPAKSTTSTSQPQPQRVAPTSNPVAKYIEVTGFRINEKGPGKLQVRFAVVNHSDADIGNIVMTVNLRPSTAKP